jgi:formamidopyrimidine-DNA glycosylase
MPELPEVETIARELREADLIGLTIQKALVFWERTIAQPTSTIFSQQICRQTIQSVERRGKYLVFTLSNDTLLVHLRMTGKFLIDTEDSTAHAHERVRLYLSDGRLLRYEDQRKFGKWVLTNEPEKFLEKLGIEPLSDSFTLNHLKTLLKGSKRQIKPFLLDQRFIAGIGNIYADEALWLAKIHPLRGTNSLSKKEIAALHQAIIAVLEQGIKNIGTSLGAARANYFSVSRRRGNNQYALNVFRREKLPCPRCQQLIRKIVVGQRGTHFCPHCQKQAIKT